MKAATVESWVEPATSASVNTIIDHRRLGQRRDHHLAARADAAEAGADVESRERQKESSAAEQAR